jgi:hypothetical protein
MRSAISLFTLIGMSGMSYASSTGARALDKTKCLDWKSHWVRDHGAEIAPWGARRSGAGKSRGLGQQAASNPEHQAPFKADLQQVAAGVKAGDATTCCMPATLPRAMTALRPMSTGDPPGLKYFSQ